MNNKSKIIDRILMVFLPIAAGLALVVYFQQSFFLIVDPHEKAVVFLFGKAQPEPLGPGPHWRLPAPFQVIEKVNVEEDRKVQIGFADEAETNVRKHIPRDALVLTSDANLVDIEVEINYHISDIIHYVVQDIAPELSLKNAAEASLKTVIGKNTINAVLTEGKSLIASEVRQDLQKLVDTYQLGLAIDRVQFIRVLNPKEVRAAFEGVESAKQDSAIAVENGLAYQNKELPLARGRAERTVRLAEAYASSRVTRAEGDAERFTRLYEKYKGAKKVTRKRMYLEAMEEVLPGMKKVIVDERGSTLNLLNLGGKK